MIVADFIALSPLVSYVLAMHSKGMMCSSVQVWSFKAKQLQNTGLSLQLAVLD